MCYLDGEVVVCSQHHGPDVQLKVFGDEFYARHESMDGYTVVYDTQARCYCYATLAVGHLVSSGVPLHKNVPHGLRKHLKEDPEVRNGKFGRRYEGLRPREELAGNNAMRTFGSEGGLLEGRRLSHGPVNGLTILVNFTDIKTTITAADVTEMMNADGYTGNGNHCSVKEYFQIVSNGNLTYTNTVVGPIELPHSRGHYINNSLVEEALDIAIQQHGINLADFDSQGEGVVDALTFLYAGQSQYNGDLWPHNAVQVMQRGFMRTHFYMLTGLGSSKIDLRIGTICHENGHMLCRFPDMYDYGRRDGDTEKSQGIGRYCLMGSGNHLNNRRSPSPVSAYLRELAGWSQVIPINGGGEVQASHGQYDQVLKYQLDDSVNEYYLIENRSKLGLDGHLPSSGLAIYHCDRLGSNEWQDGTRTRHYQCALIQADGHLDLENNVNPGDAGDLFAEVAGVAASGETQPSTRRWDGSDSGLIVSDVSGPGEVMSFRIGASREPISEAESFPDAIIPDNKPAGVEDSVVLSASGSVTDLEVQVMIIHTWISDLTITLTAPDGSEAVLHANEGDDGDDIDATYTSATLASLQALADTAVNGEWKLKVVDEASLDVGRLLYWRIKAGFQPGGEVTGGTASPNAQIPDFNSTGIESSIPISASGSVQEITVHVDIEHSYIGDLEVDLVAPSGVSVRLHDNEGSFQDNIQRSYDLESRPALAAMLGQGVEGDWKLRIRDLAPQDSGVLKTWELELTT